MNTAKDEVRRLLDSIPDDASFSDIRYKIYVREKVEEGLRDVEEGRVIDHAEIERRMDQWTQA